MTTPVAEALPEDIRRRLLASAPTSRAQSSTIQVPPSSQRWFWAAATGWATAAALLLTWLAPWSIRTTSTVAERRAGLLAPNAGAIRAEWAKSEHPDAKSASGDVVWSTAKQEGFMRFAGLRPNDPTKEQYQLWVFDEKRDDRY